MESWRCILLWFLVSGAWCSYLKGSVLNFGACSIGCESPLAPRTCDDPLAGCYKARQDVAASSVFFFVLQHRFALALIPSEDKGLCRGCQIDGFDHLDGESAARTLVLADLTCRADKFALSFSTKEARLSPSRLICQPQSGCGMTHGCPYHRYHPPSRAMFYWLVPERVSSTLHGVCCEGCCMRACFEKHN
jgi:hypothetical protein